MYDFNNTIGDGTFTAEEKEEEVAIFLAGLLRTEASDTQFDEVNAFVELLMDELDIEYSVSDWQADEELNQIEDFIEALRDQENE
jgi:hypothetical protein